MKHIHIKGFTLLELLVALSIFSILSVMAYGGLQTVITTKQSTQVVSERLAQVQLTMLRLSQDLRQALPRTIRDEQGDMISAMASNRNGDEVLEWTRAGYRNPARLKRSNIQRVGYKIEDEHLVRLTWTVLDRAQDTEELQTQMLGKIIALEWRFLNRADEWLSQWPEAGNSSQKQSLPKAIEVKLELKDWGIIKRLILVASDA